MTRFAELGRNGVGEAVLCLRVSPRGCLAASAVSASRLPSAPLPESPVDGRDGAVRGQRGAAAGEETNGGAAVAAAAAMRGAGRRGGGRRREGRKTQEGRKPEVRRRRRAGAWGWEMVSSLWVSISSCRAAGLCALCFSSYCLGIPVGTLPAPKPGSRRHPSRSAQRQRGTSAG